MRNNNDAIIRKITRKTLGANKNRNFFIAAAVMLTAFMLTSVFSVGISLITTLRINPYRFEGTLTHLAFPLDNELQLQTLSELQYIRYFGISGRVGNAALPDVCGAMVFVDENVWSNFVTPTFSRVQGNFATAENEIMLSRHKLDLMGFNYPYIGMEIPLELDITGERHEKTFILSAMYSE